MIILPPRLRVVDRIARMKVESGQSVHGEKLAIRVHLWYNVGSKIRAKCACTREVYIMPTIWVIGDSTVEDNKPPFRGWGWALPQHAAEGVTVRNHALSGRSTRSFRDEGLFTPVQEGMQKGDLLLIQFGHNDEKSDAERHTDPDSTYPEFLSWYCDEAEQRGATPVLITSVSRRFFVDNSNDMFYTHGEYPAAVRKLAQERGVPFVDLKKRSRELFLSLGAEKTAELFVRITPGENPDFPNGHDDKTHFNAHGAEVIASLVADGLRQDERTRPYLK